MKPKQDIRQSDNWAEYLGRKGWESHRIKNGSNILYKKTFLGSVVKVQHPPLLKKEDLEEIETFCKSKGAMFIKIESFIGQEMSIFKDFGYINSTVPNLPTSSMYIDLTLSEEDLWGKVSKSGKYSIRRAQREGAVVEYFQNPTEGMLRDYYKIVKETGKKKHFYIPPYEDFLDKLEIFGDGCHILLAKNKKGEVTGAKMCLCHNKDMVLYTTGGTTELGRKGKSGYELTWKSFLYFKKLGYKVFDLEGVDDDRFYEATKKWGGFSYFKEKFGGEIIRFPYPQIKYLSPFLKILSKIYTIPF